MPRGAGARQRSQLSEALSAAAHAVLSRLDMPSVAVGAVRIEGGTLLAHIAGEATPRRIENVSGVSGRGSGL